MKRLVRPKNGRMIAGVALGIARYANMNPALVRAAFVFLFFAGGVPAIILYALGWVLMPSEGRVSTAARV